MKLVVDKKGVDEPGTHRLQTVCMHVGYVSKVFGYYNHVTILTTKILCMQGGKKELILE